MKVVAEVWSWIVAVGVWFTEFERGTFAELISGVGSLAAAIVAVCLAYKAQKIKLIGTLDLMVEYSTGERVVSITATNVGQRNATIKSIFFSIKRRKFAGLQKVEDWVLIPDRLPRSTSLPATLTDGITGHWHYPAEETIEILANLAKTEENARTLFCELFTTHGKKVEVKPSTHLVDTIIKKIKNQT